MKVLIMKIIRIMLIAGLCFRIVPSLFAGVGSSSAEFLLIPVGARPSAMGDTFVGIADDIHALGYNPAGLGRITRRELLLMHSAWLVDTNYEYAAYIHPLPKGSVGFSISYLDAGDLIGRNTMGQPTGDFSATDLAVKVGYGYPVLDEMYLGISAAYIAQKIDDASRSGGSLDIGFLWELIPDRLHIGSAIQHAGPKLPAFDTEEESLPLTYRIGLGYYIAEKKLLIGSELKKIIHGKPALNTGIEYKIKNILFVRAGAVLGSDRDESLPVTAGVGLIIRDYNLDYAFEPFGELDVTHRIALSLKF